MVGVSLPRDLFALEPGVKLETVLSVAKKLLVAYKDTSPILSEEANEAFKDAIDHSAADEKQQMERLQRLMHALAEVMATNDRIAYSNRMLVHTFLEYATQPAFMIRLLQERRKKS